MRWLNQKLNYLKGWCISNRAARTLLPIWCDKRDSGFNRDMRGLMQDQPIGAEAQPRGRGMDL
jgi:hypothetical protein